MADLVIRAGVTEPVTFQLKTKNRATGVITAVDLTDYTALVLRVLKRQTGAVVQAFNLSVADTSTGQVTYSPGANDLTEGQYDAWITGLNASGKSVSFPSDSNYAIQCLGTF